MNEQMIETITMLQPVLNEKIEEAIKNPQPTEAIQDGDFGYYIDNPKKKRIFFKGFDHVVAWSLDELWAQGYYHHFGADVNQHADKYVIAGNIHSLQMEQAV
jgi:hypothetical protein